MAEGRGVFKGENLLIFFWKLNLKFWYGLLAQLCFFFSFPRLRRVAWVAPPFPLLFYFSHSDPCRKVRMRLNCSNTNASREYKCSNASAKYVSARAREQLL